MILRVSGLQRFLTGVTVASLAVAVPAQQQTPQQQSPIRSGAKTVAVYATVTDKDGRLVPDLGREAFEIRDNGKPQPVAVFSNEIQPITVALMVDRSGSMRGNVRLVEEGAAAFIRRLRPADRARVGSFADRIEIQPEAFTSDHAALLAAVQSDMPVSGPTPLWNALDMAIGALRGEPGRKVVLVFSDGGNSPSGFGKTNRSIVDVIRQAQQEDIMVYAIGLQATVQRSRGGGGIGGMIGGLTLLRPDPGLGMIADETGGGYFELTKADNLATTFARVAEELHRQYVIGFEPPVLDDKVHELEVRVNQRGMKVRARQAYVATRPGG